MLPGLQGSNLKGQQDARQLCGSSGLYYSFQQVPSSRSCFLETAKTFGDPEKTGAHTFTRGVNWPYVTVIVRNWKSSLFSSCVLRKPPLTWDELSSKNARQSVRTARLFHIPEVRSAQKFGGVGVGAATTPSCPSFKQPSSGKAS